MKTAVSEKTVIWTDHTMQSFIWLSGQMFIWKPPAGKKKKNWMSPEENSRLLCEVDQLRPGPVSSVWFQELCFHEKPPESTAGCWWRSTLKSCNNQKGWISLCRPVISRHKKQLIGVSMTTCTIYDAAISPQSSSHLHVLCFCSETMKQAWSDDLYLQRSAWKSSSLLRS